MSSYLIRNNGTQANSIQEEKQFILEKEIVHNIVVFCGKEAEDIELLVLIRK